MRIDEVRIIKVKEVLVLVMGSEKIEFILRIRPFKDMLVFIKWEILWITMFEIRR
jgi:hypothetical protein